MTAKQRAHILFVIALLLLILSIAEGEQISEAIRASLSLCARSLIPALLPSLVVSGLLVSVATEVRMPFDAFFSRIFRLPRIAATAFLLGALCGFPIGAHTAAHLFERGALSREEAERTAALSANTGPTFCVLAVGVGFFESVRVGWWIYAIQLSSAILLGIIDRRGKGSKSTAAPALAASSFSFSDGIYRAAITLLSVSATVCFFSAVCAPLAHHLPPFPAALLSAILEVGGGCYAASRLTPPLGMLLASFSVSLSGISVLLQSAAALTPSGIGIAPLVKRKLAQAALALILSLLTLPTVM